MFIGHFAVGFAAKRYAPRTSLGTLFLAAQFLDLLWPSLVLAGVESVRIAPGNTTVTPLDFVSYPISHSLLTSLGWGALIGAIYFALRRDVRASIVVALAVVSHWLLDFLTHRPDLPLFPGGTRVGLGLWDSRPGTIAVEVAIFCAGLLLYIRTTAARDRSGVYLLWALSLFLLVVYFLNLYGPPPPSVTAIGVAGEAIWLLVAWGYWTDYHREVWSPPGQRESTAARGGAVARPTS